MTKNKKDDKKEMLKAVTKITEKSKNSVIIFYPTYLNYFNIRKNGSYAYTFFNKF